MKKITFSVLMFLAASTLIFSQNNQSQNEKFKIVKVGKTYSQEQLSKAVSQADWCGYFHKSENYTLTFDDGAVVELLSFALLANKGIVLEGSCVQQEANTDNSIYGIHASGYVTKQVPKNSHVKSISGK